ncbi:hypothetical protein FSP39_010446 [Pinctada imbricata]|uniref:RING-type domain-containing protein n=1 Tax=Pinctada imbricata TaxID=66713 RepID=A0AA88YBN7_PINIB|nr:hypothetical protein FSP39_010446 [Pinctada imbricata]
MHRATKVKINPDLHPHLVCVLCSGYLIDATTIVECLHSFCKTCIVRYLETSKFCPICDVQVHKTKPFTNIRLDHTLQDIVYKLVPGLFKEEMKRRRDFYREHHGEDTDAYLNDINRPEYYIDEDGEIQRERVIFSEDEEISLALELSTDGRPPAAEKELPVENKKNRDCRYLLCPAAVTIGHLKKFIRLKFNLCDAYQIEIYHTDEQLKDEYTLMDVAYIYMWRRKGPLRLYYTVFTNAAKRFKKSLTCTETKELNDYSHKEMSPIKDSDSSSSESDQNSDDSSNGLSRSRGNSTGGKMSDTEDHSTEGDTSSSSDDDTWKYETEKKSEAHLIKISATKAESIPTITGSTKAEISVSSPVTIRNTPTKVDTKEIPKETETVKKKLPINVAIDRESEKKVTIKTNNECETEKKLTISISNDRENEKRKSDDVDGCVKRNCTEHSVTSTKSPNNKMKSFGDKFTEFLKGSSMDKKVRDDSKSIAKGESTSPIIHKISGESKGDSEGKSANGSKDDHRKSPSVPKDLGKELALAKDLGKELALAKAKELKVKQIPVTSKTEKFGSIPTSPNKLKIYRETNSTYNGNINSTEKKISEGGNGKLDKANSHDRKRILDTSEKSSSGNDAVGSPSCSKIPKIATDEIKIKNDENSNRHSLHSIKKVENKVNGSDSLSKSKSNGGNITDSEKANNANVVIRQASVTPGSSEVNPDKSKASLGLKSNSPPTKLNIPKCIITNNNGKMEIRESPSVPTTESEQKCISNGSKPSPDSGKSESANNENVSKTSIVCQKSISCTADFVKKIVKTTGNKCTTSSTQTVSSTLMRQNQKASANKVQNHKPPVSSTNVSQRHSPVSSNISAPRSPGVAVPIVPKPPQITLTKPPALMSSYSKQKQTTSTSSQSTVTLSIPSIVSSHNSITPSVRAFTTSPLTRTISSSPTRRKMTQPARRITSLPLSSQSNGRPASTSSISPTGFPLSVSPTERAFHHTPTAYSFSSTGRTIASSPLALPNRIFTFANPRLERSVSAIENRAIHNMTLNVPNAHVHFLPPRLNGSIPFVSSHGHLNGDVPQDLSMKKKGSDAGTSQHNTKSEKKTPSPKSVMPNGEIDKFAFTDEDDTPPPISPRKLHLVKSEPSSAN